MTIIAISWLLMQLVFWCSVCVAITGGFLAVAVAPFYFAVKAGR